MSSSSNHPSRSGRNGVQGRGSLNTSWQTLKKPSVIIALILIYTLAGKLSLKLAFVQPNASVVWPPSGIALAALLLLGTWAWPAILVGSFLVNFTTAGTVATSAGIAIGNTLEALLAVYLVKRFADGKQAFARARTIFQFAVFAGMVSTAVSATVGVATLCLGGFASWAHFEEIWLTWWLGNAAGNVVVAPALILWGSDYYLRGKRDRFFEATTLVACLVIVSEVVFNGLSVPVLGSFPLGLLCVPLLIWAAFRFGPRETSAAIVVMSAIAIRGALHGLAPFEQKTTEGALLLIQAVTIVSSVIVLAVAAGISERKRLEATASHLAAVVESSFDAIIGKTMNGTILSWNNGAEAMYGYTAEEAIGQNISLIIPMERREELSLILARVEREENVRHLETVRVRKDGSLIDVSLTVSPVRGAKGEIVGASAIAHDITERKRSEAALRESNETLKIWVHRLERQTHEIALLNHLVQMLQMCQGAEEVFVVIRQFAGQLFPLDSGSVALINPSFNLVETVSVWGDAPPAEQVFSPQECWALRTGQVHAVQDVNRLLRCEHLSYESPIDSLCVPVIAQGETLGVLHLRRTAPVTQEEIGSAMTLANLASREQLASTVANHIALALANLKMRDTLRAQSIRDPLTGLYNRRYLTESLEREVRRASRSQRALAVIMLDVDHFKGFNDTLGHDAGDALLQELGAFLQGHTRTEDTPCRYGGDEFVIILAEASMDVALRRARQLQEGIKRLRVPFGNGYLAPPTISLGVAVYPEHGVVGESLLHSADEALYRAKAGGRDQMAVGHLDETA